MDQEANLLDHRYEDSKYRPNEKANLLFENASSDEEDKESKKSKQSEDLLSPNSIDREDPGTVDFNLHQTLKLYNVEGPYQINYLKQMTSKEEQK